MLIPYRVKNPWKKFPIATVSIISLNVLIYLCTTEYGLVIRDSVVEHYAFQLGESNFFCIFSAMFLHADIFHILGNMLFFWVFSPPVEDRLGIPRFLLVYFLTGIAGDLLQALLDVMTGGQVRPGLGASGCIMGIMGAYWYLFSWSTVCVFYWFGIFARGVWEVQAIWIIGIFVALDIVEGIFSGSSGGVANFAHVGGGLSGLLLCLLLRIKRDTEQVSQAKASHAEVKDLTLVPLGDLEIMRRDEPLNADVIKAIMKVAPSLGRSDMIERAFADAGSVLITQSPELVVRYLLSYRGDHSIYTPAHLLRLARHAESGQNTQHILAIYDLILSNHPKAPETEIALYRSALCSWQRCHDPVNARTCLQELLTRYPFGSLEQHAKSLLRELP